MSRTDETSAKASPPAPLSPGLLEILRCPVALMERRGAADVGRLRLYEGCWLICDESGMKYPIVEGMPVLLPAEGERWRDTAEKDLPIPPPTRQP